MQPIRCKNCVREAEDETILYCKKCGGEYCKNCECDCTEEFPLWGEKSMIDQEKGKKNPCEGCGHNGLCYEVCGRTYDNRPPALPQGPGLTLSTTEEIPIKQAIEELACHVPGRDNFNESIADLSFRTGLKEGTIKANYYGQRKLLVPANLLIRILLVLARGERLSYTMKKADEITLK